MRLIDFHEHTMSAIAARIDSLTRHDLTVPTKLGWSVSELIAHLATVNVMCRNSAAGIGPEALGDPVAFIGHDAVAAYQRTRAEFTAAYASPDTYTRVLPTPVGAHPGSTVLTVGTLESMIHGWDLANALNHEPFLPDDLTVEATGRILTLGTLFEEFRARDFYAAPQPVGPDASPQDRLLAFLGRTP